MTESDILIFVSYAMGSFAIGFGVGFFTVYFKKAIDNIL